MIDISLRVPLCELSTLLTSEPWYCYPNVSPSGLNRNLVGCIQGPAYDTDHCCHFDMGVGDLS